MLKLVISLDVGVESLKMFRRRELRGLHREKGDLLTQEEQKYGDLVLVINHKG